MEKTENRTTPMNSFFILLFFTILVGLGVGLFKALHRIDVLNDRITRLENQLPKFEQESEIEPAPNQGAGWLN